MSKRSNEFDHGVTAGFVMSARIADDNGHESIAFEILNQAGIFNKPLCEFDEQDQGLISRWQVYMKRVQRSYAKSRRRVALRRQP